MGNLYIIGTPIGNLGDISKRALDILNSVEVIFCEDTRVTKKLLSNYNIQKKLYSYHSFSGVFKIDKAIELLKKDFDVALVSDAGTPTISDPGVKFVSKVKEVLGEDVIKVIPGASAVISALSISGAPASSFLFLGFAPRKHKRDKFFEKVGSSEETVVFFESPHRIMKTLERLVDFVGDREVIVAKELTKIYERTVSGSASYVYSYFLDNIDKQKGEFVIIVSSLHKQENM